MNQSREAHHSARPHHSPRGHTTRTLRTHGQPSMKRPGDPPTAMIQPSRTPRSHARVGMTLPPAASMGTGLTVERPGMCSVTAMRPAQTRAIPDTPRPKVLLSRAIIALTERRPFASPFRYGGGRLQRLRTATHQRFRWSEPVWSPPPESNRRPHPYHGSAAKRRANRCLRRSHCTVEAAGMCSLNGAGCDHGFLLGQGRKI
jgi:hypothetical protein